MKISNKIAILVSSSLFCFVQSNAQIDVINTTNDYSLSHELIDEVYESRSSDFHFTENKGQLISSVKYHCKLHIGDIFFKDNQFSFDLFSADELDKVHDLKHNHLEDSSSSFVF